MKEQEYLEAKKIVELYESGNANLHPSFWFMADNHTFARLTGNSIEDIKESAIKIAKENPYGMVCPVTILRGETELRRVGDCCHVDGNGNVDLTEWFREIQKEECVKNFTGINPLSGG